MLEAHWLVLPVLAQFFVAEENYAHSDLFQPDDATNEPRSIHRAERGEPGDKEREREIGVQHKLVKLYKYLGAVVKSWRYLYGESKLP